VSVHHIGNRALYYERHGQGTPVLCMGGWGTFCHGRVRDLPRTLLDNHQVIIYDYPGIGESDIGDLEATTKGLAGDAANLLTALNINQIDVVGMVGLGACIAQELAIAYGDIVRKLVMAGTWCTVDMVLRDQLELFLATHVRMGFDEFQRLCAVYSFDPSFYNDNRERILGPDKAWADLRGHEATHESLVNACLSHETRAFLGGIKNPTLIFHSGQDLISGPRLTREIEELIPNSKGIDWPEAAHIIAGRDAKVKFSKYIESFLTEE